MEFQNRKPKIGIFGIFQNGKSTLINCIFKKKYAAVGGKGVSVTSLNTIYTYGQGPDIAKITYCNGNVETFSLPDFQELDINNQYSYSTVTLMLNNDNLRYFDLLDTPGFNANEHDSDIAESAVVECDMGILVVRNKGLSQTEKCIAKMLRNKNVPFIVIMNCFCDNSCYEMWSPSNNQNKAIRDNILADLNANGCPPTQFNMNNIVSIYSVNLLWYWLSIMPDDENPTIKLAHKMIKYLWDDFETEDYSNKKLAENSNVNDFICIFNNIYLNKILVKCFLLKERNNKIRHILCKMKSNNAESKDFSIKCIIVKLQANYDSFYKSKEKELNEIKNDKTYLNQDTNLFSLAFWMKEIKKKVKKEMECIRINNEIELKRQELNTQVEFLNTLIK